MKVHISVEYVDRVEVLVFQKTEVGFKAVTVGIMSAVCIQSKN